MASETGTARGDDGPAAAETAPGAAPGTATGNAPGAATETAPKTATETATGGAGADAVATEEERRALGWGRPAPRGALGRALDIAGRTSRRGWRAALKLSAQGRARLTQPALERLRDLALADPARGLRLARRLLPAGALRAEAEALLTARSAGWPAAAPLFEAAASARAGARAGPAGDHAAASPAAFLLRPRPPVPAVALAAPAAARPAFLPDAAADGIVVYTACFGRRPNLPPIAAAAGDPARARGAARVRFVCFTDSALAVPGWQVVPGAAPTDEPAAAAAFHKIRPHDVLAAVCPDAERSLFLAEDTHLVGNLDTLIARWLMPQDLALWRHPRCIDWHDIAEHRLVGGGPLGDRGAPAATLAQAAAAAGRAVPRDRGALDTRAIWRRHAAPRVVALMEAWWRAEAAAPGADEISLYRVLHDPAAPPALRPAVLPEKLGAAGDNVFCIHAPRRSPAAPEAGRAAAPEVAPEAAPEVKPEAAPGGGIGAPGLRRARLPIAFLYAGAHARTATTFLRGEQLSGLVAAAYPDRYDVLYTDDADAVRDRVVILTKSALKTRPAEAVAAIRERNAAAVGSWDDVHAEPAKAAILDAHMTLSIRQTLEMNRLYPGTPAYMVTHHVNTQVPKGRPPADRLRTAYLGDLRNTVRPESLAGLVDLVGINTTRVNDSWLEALPRYNCHWIVRQRQPWNGWKPFLKAFVAARCGAVVVATRDDGDALHYLGDDYPFYAESLEPADLEMAMAGVAAAFGGPEWRLAGDIMAQVEARTTHAQVCAEFAAMIDEIAR